MTDGRVIFDCDFTALADAAYWPHPDFRVVAATYGATATVVSGAGHLDGGNASAGSWAAGITLRMRPPVTDRFEVFLRGKIMTASASGSCWLSINYRSTSDWSGTNGSGAGDLNGDVRQRYTTSIGNKGASLGKRVSYSSTSWPDFLNDGWCAVNDIVCCRLRVVGKNHSVKIWKESDGEPSYWQARVVDDAATVWKNGVPAGFITLSVGSQNAHGQFDVSRIVIREVGDPWDPVLTNYGTASFTGTGAQTAFVIPHGLDLTPTAVQVTPKTQYAGAVHWVSAVDATNITVTFTTAPGNGQSVIFDWRADTDMG